MKNKENLHTQTGAWRNIFGIASNEYEKFGGLLFAGCQTFWFILFLQLISLLYLLNSGVIPVMLRSFTHLVPLWFFFILRQLLELCLLFSLLYALLGNFWFCFSVEQFYTNFWNLESWCQMDLLSPDQLQSLPTEETHHESWLWEQVFTGRSSFLYFGPVFESEIRTVFV